MLDGRQSEKYWSPAVAGEKHGSAVRDSDGVKPASVQLLRHDRMEYLLFRGAGDQARSPFVPLRAINNERRLFVPLRAIRVACR